MEHANADNRMQPEAPLIYRTKLPVRIWHWINAFSIFVMLMSGMSIFNAHPASTGASTANFDQPWLVIGNHGDRGFVNLLGLELPAGGLLGVSSEGARAFPPLLTILRTTIWPAAANGTSSSPGCWRSPPRCSCSTRWYRATCAILR
jgi:hypothetical protein